MNKLENLSARDVMRTDVATLATDDTIETALALFDESRIGGAPVVANGQLVGMLTLSDISRPEHLKGSGLETRRDYDLTPDEDELAEDFDAEQVIYLKDDYSPDVLGRELVGDWMSSGVVSVSPDTPLERVCQVMLEKQVHRVCVTEASRLVGLISSIDVVRQVAGWTRKKPARASTAR